jgi:hypothetical protein
MGVAILGLAPQALRFRPLRGLYGVARFAGFMVSPAPRAWDCDCQNRKIL